MFYALNACHVVELVNCRSLHIPFIPTKIQEENILWETLITLK